MGKKISVRSPARIDLAGGWTDVPTFCNNVSGEVVNIAINKYVRSEMIIDDERKLSLSYHTDMPTGSGLGTSGAMNVALISTISSAKQTSLKTAEIAFQFEALLGNKGGRQDQWASALGGINWLTFKGEEVSVEHLSPSSEFCNWIENHLLLFNSHITHVSGDLHKEVWSKFEQGDNNISHALDTIRDAGLLMVEAIKEESITKFVEAIRLNSAGVDGLGSEYHDPFRDNLEQMTEQGTILAWKAMGAGGGGVVGLIVGDLANTQSVITKLEDNGWTNLDWKIDFEGTTRTETNL